MFNMQRKIAGMFLVAAGAALAGCDNFEQTEAKYELKCTDADGLSFLGTITTRATPTLIQKDGFYAITGSDGFRTETTTLEKLPVSQNKCSLDLVSKTVTRLN